MASYSFDLDWSNTNYADTSMDNSTLSYYSNLVTGLRDARVDAHVTLFGKLFAQGFSVLN